MTEIKQKPNIIFYEIVGIIIMLIIGWFIFGTTIIQFFGTHKDKQIICVNNQREIAISLQMFTDDHNGIYPESSSIWTDIKIDSDILICDKAKDLKNGYLYNNNLSGIMVKKIADPTEKLLTVDGENKLTEQRAYYNVYYTPTDVRYRHGGQVIASYVDGHVEVVNKITEPESWDKPAKKY